MSNNKLEIEKTLRSLPSPSSEEMESARSRILDKLNADDGRPVRYSVSDCEASEPVRRRRSRFVPAAALAAGVLLAFVVPFVFKTAKDAPALLESTNRGVAYDEVIRSGGSGDVVRLSDSTRIEMRSESELRLEKLSDGVRIRLNHGGVIVNAAKQEAGRHLYVQTKDVLVSVVGTVFLVRAEEEGSRVAVIEGEVRVQQGSLDKKLLPGDQVTSDPGMRAVPVKDEIAWSRQVETHLAMLQQSVPATAGVSEPAVKPVLTGFRVSGNVVQSPGSTIRSRTLRLSEELPSGPPEERQSRLLAQRFFQTELLPDGTFAFTNIPAGSFRLDFDLGAFDISVNVKDRDVSDLRVNIPFKTNSEGHVVMDDGSPLPDRQRPTVFILSAVRGRTVNPVTSSTEGKFQVTLYEGENQINVSTIQRGYALKSISYGGQELKPGSDPRLWGPIKLEGDAKEIRITLAVMPVDPLPSYRISGKLKNPSVEYFDGATRMIRLIGMGNEFGLPPISTELLADGSFEFPKVEQGSYRLMLEAGSPLVESFGVRDREIRDLGVDLRNNPFPEYSSYSVGGIFSTGPDLAFEGTLTEEITVIPINENLLNLQRRAIEATQGIASQGAPAGRYFRFAVENPSPGMPRSWAVVMLPQNPLDADLAKLKAGARIRVVLHRAKDGTPRARLVPQTGPNTVAGIVLLDK